MTALGRFNVRLASLDELRATRTALSINSQENIFVSAVATYFRGDVYFNDGRLGAMPPGSSGTGGISLSTSSGNLLLDPAGTIEATKELVTSSGLISSSGAPLVLESHGGDIVLNPDPGHVVRTNAQFTTSDGRFVSEVGSVISTLQDDLELSPFRYLIATVPFKTRDGTIAAIGPAQDLVLSTEASGGRVVVGSSSLAFSASSPSIVGSNGLTITASSGPVAIGRDTLFTTGTLTSPAGVPLTLTPGSGVVTIDGDLNVAGDIVTMNSTVVTLEDKNIVLAATTSPSDAYADGAGVIVQGSSYASNPKELSLIWNASAGGAPRWQLSGGNFWITRRLTSDVVVTYRFDIDDETQDLVIRKQVDADDAVAVAEFNSYAG